MSLLDSELLGAELAELIREHVNKQVAPLIAQVATLKAQIAETPRPKDGVNGKDAKEVDLDEVARRAAALIEPPKDGKDADPEFIRREVTAQVSAMPKPVDGKSVDMTAVFTEIGAAVKRAIDALPPAKNGENGKDGSNGINGKDGLPGKDGENGKDGELGAEGKPGLNGKDADPEKIRVAVLDAVSQLPKPKDGKDADPVVMQVMIENEVLKQIQTIPKPVNGKDADPAFIRAEVKAAVDLIPKPKDGHDGKDVDMGEVLALVKSAVAEIPKPQDGKDADPETIQKLVDEAVSKIPPAKDGKSVQPETVTAMVRAEVERAMATIQLPEDGQDGRDGKDGRDGANGFGFDDIDFSASLKGERTLSIALRSGGREIVREVKMPIPVYKGVHRPGVAYEKSDCVTHGGSLWIASKDTSATPKNGDDSDWRLSVKRGRDGTDLDRS